jgi:SAM-dependent methyltransferase
VKRYSKPSGPLIRAKQAFFEENAALLAGAEAINRAYAEQPRRMACKVCEAPLPAPAFTSFGVGYCVCAACTHLNGAHEDTEAFAQRLYQADGGAAYGANYLAAYDARVEAIYLPKVDFLLEVLAAEGVEAPRVLDVGCGGGHFVRACELRGLPARGIDPSETLVALGGEKLSSNAIRACQMADFTAEIAGADEPVVSMIGVLEHLQHPLAALEAFRASSARHLYISVPLFSLSALLEHAFDDVFPRQLSGGHTHLFTPQSLERLAERFGLVAAGEWWFGTDMVDLLRSLTVRGGGEPAFAGLVQQMLGPQVDALQAVLDQARACSEVHMVFRKA